LIWKLPRAGAGWKIRFLFNTGRATCWRACAVWNVNACNETKLVHYLSSVYSVTITLHVSGLLLVTIGMYCMS
jgi:hypothetical protein